MEYEEYRTTVLLLEGHALPWGKVEGTLQPIAYGKRSSALPHTKAELTYGASGQGRQTSDSSLRTRTLASDLRSTGVPPRTEKIFGKEGPVDGYALSPA